MCKWTILINKYEMIQKNERMEESKKMVKTECKWKILNEIFRNFHISSGIFVDNRE